ncbi:MAG: hypothetical protein HY721_06060, partial [Planctomycetes bacterium]|nr:hypothetical protein [Planctomycetota bacterium]
MDILKFLESQTRKKTVGTLTLGKRKSFREVFFQGESVYLVGDRFSGKVALSKLAELGIPGRRVSAAELEAVIAETDRTRNLVASALRERGLLDDAEFLAAAQENLFEDLLELLFTGSGSFCFQEGRVPEYILSGEDVAVRVPLSAEAAAAELRRRAQLLPALEVLVPSREEILVLTEKGLGLRQRGEGDAVLRRLLELVDGLRDLGSIIDASCLHEIPAISQVARALETGAAKKTIHPELKGLSTHTCTREEAERYLPHLKNAVKYGVDELAGRERLAVVYEKLGCVDEAVIQYNFVGDALYRAGKASKAIKAYQRALALKPTEVLVAHKITGIYSKAAEEEIAAGNTAQAVAFLQGALKLRPEDPDVFARLLQLLVREQKLQDLAGVCDFVAAHARRTGNPEAAIQAYRGVLQELPRSAAFRKKLINLYLDFGLNAEATQEMQALASDYVERGQAGKAQELVEKMRKVGTGGREARQLERRVTASLAQDRRRAPPRLFLAFAACFLAYQVWSYGIWTDLRRGAATAQASGEPALGLAPAAEEASCLEAARRCEAFIAGFPFSLFRPEAERLLALQRERGGGLAARREERARRILLEARAQACEGRREAAATLLEPLLALPAGCASRAEAEALIEEVRRHELSAEQLLAAGRRLVEEGWPKEAYRAYRRL